MSCRESEILTPANFYTEEVVNKFRIRPPKETNGIGAKEKVGNKTPRNPSQQ